MSAEEMKIRGELEMDVERDLEEEIKDGIYHLALRLHRLYQHQKERINAREYCAKTAQQGLAKKKTLSEINISIRMDGGTKIEIKEIKKQTREHGHSLALIRSENGREIAGAGARKFDWAKSLRSEARPLVINKKYESYYQAKGNRNGHNLHQAVKLDSANNRNFMSTVSGRKGSMVPENKLLELGWKC
ncbi:uncharacterized protein LOC127804664 [Diospyros lotus]|uniref:uncharacterized protein LOC127804664 n=1 Tax=Diospyros lotus TaxID=55363 RepID=UPI002253C3D8|nr:uncharacterized protein LOC127804664 [Diospyros lotus]